jgi:hypothetical protein
VREEYTAHHQTNDGQGKVVARVYYFFEHSRLAFGFCWTARIREPVDWQTSRTLT